MIVLLIKPYGNRFIYTFIPTVNHFTFLETVINYIARVASPLALLVLGGQFDFKKNTRLSKTDCHRRDGEKFIGSAYWRWLGAVVLHKLGVVYFNEVCLLRL